MPKLPVNFFRKNKMTEIKNAVISEVFIGFSTNNELTSWIIMNFGIAKQGFGGLDFSINNNAVNFLASVLAVVGVAKTNDLIGKAVRVEHDRAKIYAIGNYVEDRWYNIDTGVISEGQQAPIACEDDVADITPPTVDQDGKKHYGLKADPGAMGAKLG